MFDKEYDKTRAGSLIHLSMPLPLPVMLIKHGSLNHFQEMTAVRGCLPSVSQTTYGNAFLSRYFVSDSGIQK